MKPILILNIGGHLGEIWKGNWVKKLVILYCIYVLENLYINDLDSKQKILYSLSLESLYAKPVIHFAVCEFLSDHHKKRKKMLAVFEKSIAKSPEALQSPHSSASESVSALKDGYLANHFSSLHPASVTINLGSAGLLAYSVDKLNPLLPRFILYRNICLSLSRTVSASGENSVSYLCHNIFYLLLSQSNCWVMLHFLFCILLLLEIANFPFTEYFFFSF